MKKVLFAICFLLATYLQAQDVIVTNDLQTLTVYNVEVGATSVFFQKSLEAGAEIHKLPVSEVMIIRKADGARIVPNAAQNQATTATQKEATRSRILVPHAPAEPVKAEVCSDIKQTKEGRQFKAATPDGVELNYRVLSEEEHTLEVTGKDKSVRSKNHKTIIIPETIDIYGVVFTVTQIGEKAFYQSLIEEYLFPKTLKRIGDKAFFMANIKSILLPEGLEEIGYSAFYSAGMNAITHVKQKFEYIYIPTSVTTIGEYAFRNIGKNTSSRGYTEARIDCMPEFITKENCTFYGIDHNAIEEYERRLEQEYRIKR